MPDKTRLAQGWGYPLNSRKAHYFLAGEMIALCRRWMYLGQREDFNHESADNCADCTRRRNLIAPQDFQ